MGAKLANFRKENYYERGLSGLRTKKKYVYNISFEMLCTMLQLHASY